MTSELYPNLLLNTTNSFFAFILVLIIGFITLKFTRKYSDSERRKRQLRTRTLYICCLIYVFLLAKIWVDGFTQILAVLGLVSAALVITNKESIMNLVGWLIINWRELFTEGDLVQIDKNKGVIKSIGLLYLTMEETIEQSGYLKTGRILKLPNNNVIIHPIINYTYHSSPILQKHELQFKCSSDINIIKSTIENVISEVISEMATNTNSQSLLSHSPKNSTKSKSSTNHKNNHIDEKNYQICFMLKHDEELYIEVIVYFYCYIDQYEDIKLNFISKIINKINASNSVFFN